jgi:hypothetical protein
MRGKDQPVFADVIFEWALNQHEGLPKFVFTHPDMCNFLWPLQVSQ